jgi:imidazolonepropionase-like amidohydrolase
MSPQITTTAQAVATARANAEDGDEAIKVYNHLRADVYDALSAEGARLGLPVVGHVPFAVGIHRALAAGQRSIEHFRGYDFDPAHPPGTSGAAGRFGVWLTLSDAALAAYAEETRAAGTWNCPTFTVIGSGLSVAEKGAGCFPPEFRFLPSGLRASMMRSVANPIFTPDATRTLAAGKPRQFALLRMMHAAGNKLLVGTDCSVPNILPGFSIHDELANFVAAGLTPRETLYCCCRNPALFYGEADRGRVAAGCRADLLLLDADPLDDIRNTRRIAGVMARGRWHDRAALRAMLEDVARRHPLSEDEAELLVAA